MARRKTHPTITLFAFQDVIMSVSGIIVVLVLLLSLELIQKPEQSAAAAAPAVVEQLRAEIERAAAAAAELEARLQANDEQIRQSAALSPADLQRQIDDFTADSEQLATETAALQSQLDDLQQRERALRIEAAERSDVHEQADDARQTADDLERQLETERAENRLVFELPRGFNKQGWIAVISANEVSVAPLGRASPPRTFTAEGGLFGSSAESRFLEWTSSLRQSDLYLLLMIRPDGTSAFESIVVELDRRGIPYGFDLVPAGQTLLHPERGAYQ